MADARKLASLAAVVQYIDDVDKWHKAAHDRARKDIDEIRPKIESNYAYLRDRCELNASRVDALTQQQAAPVSFDKVFLSPKVWLWGVGWLVTMVVTIVISFLATTASLRADLALAKSDIRDILTKMEAQKTADAARDKLRDLEAATLRSDVTEVKRLQQLQQYEIQNVKDLVVNTKARK